jgi:hypothetical protein
MGAEGAVVSPQRPSVVGKGQRQDWSGYLFISPAVALFMLDNLSRYFVVVCYCY